MKLWLDDIRDPVKFGASGFTWAKNVHEAIQLLKTGQVTVASLDHDLGMEYDEETETVIELPTGYKLVCWLEEHPEYWPVDGVTVHSQNPVGRNKMYQVIDRHYKRGL